MIKLNKQEKKELIEDATSEARRADFRQLSSYTHRLTPIEHLEDLTWASGLSKEDPRLRERAIERNMLL